MSLSRIQHQLLELAVEDYYGFWEIIWRVRNLLPNSTASQLSEIAATALRDLLSRGWVALYRQVLDTGERTPIEPSEVEAVLADPRSWAEPTSDLTPIVFGATEEGERAYYGNR